MTNLKWWWLMNNNDDQPPIEIGLPAFIWANRIYWLLKVGKKYIVSK